MCWSAIISFLNQIISYLNDDSYNMLTGYDVNVILLKGFHGFFFFFLIEDSRLDHLIQLFSKIKLNKNPLFRKKIHDIFI